MILGLCIEMRPNLGSGMAFILFDYTLSYQRITRLILKEHDLHIIESPIGIIKVPETMSDLNTEGSELIVRHNAFSMNMEEVTSFTATGKHICFRFNYTHIDLELLNKSCVKISLEPLFLQFNEEDPVAIYCNNCQLELIPTCRYNRLREFPNGFINVNEFFCHTHGSAAAASLMPDVGDLFYGLNYIVVNMEELGESIKIRGKHVYCARCCALLGTVMQHNKKDVAAKMWADALYWQVPTSPYARLFFQYSTLSHWMLRLVHSLWPLTVTELNLNNKAVLQCTLPNRHRRYMLLQVVQSHLCVLRKMRTETNAQTDWTQLVGHQACKLYFRVFQQAEVQDILLQQWLQQLDVPKVDISLDMFDALHDRFQRNTELVPHAFCYNKWEEKLLLSYFFFEDEPESQQSDLAQMMEHLNVKTEQDQEYETDAGHATQDEVESDDEHSDSDVEAKHSSKVD